MLNIDTLFSMQKELDKKIESQHGLENEALIEKKVLALLVEVGELANETKCFKFWSLKPSAPVEVILEEYVDGVHFILSLGLELKIAVHDLAITSKYVERNVTEQFLVVFESITAFKENLSMNSYKVMFEEYMYLGQILGFSSEQVEKAYISKNEVNHERQKQGY